MDKVTELRVETLDRNVGSLIMAIPEGATNFEAYRTDDGFEIKFVKVERE